MARTRRSDAVTIDVAALKRLYGRIYRLGSRGDPAVVAARARLRSSLRGRSRGDDMGWLPGAAHCLHLLQTGDPHDFGPEPEAKVEYLVVAIERLAGLAAALAALPEARRPVARVPIGSFPAVVGDSTRGEIPPV